MQPGVQKKMCFAVCKVVEKDPKAGKRMLLFNFSSSCIV